MGSAHSAVHTHQPAERQSAAPARVASAPVSPARSLQQRMGNAGAHDLVSRAQAFSKTSSPHDSAEREARSSASAVMSMTEPAAARSASGDARQCVQCKADEAADIPLELSNNIKRHMSGGAPLPDTVRAFMEPRFGASFGKVRVHADERAAALSEQLHADAFTVGQHIFFAKGKYQPETREGRELIAHELTHTIQQGESVRREEKKSWWDSITEFGESVGWSIIDSAAPALAPIIRRGPSGLWDVLKETAGVAVEGVFNTVMAPVRAITGIRDRLAADFAPLVAQIQTAAAQIARNDCSPLRDAADKIEKGAAKIILPIVQKLQPVVAKIKQLLNDIWDKIGAPIWGWIQKYAAWHWAQIKAVGDAIAAAAKWIWDKTAWVRSMARQAWTWIKNKLGIGDGPEGQDGLLQWFQRKFEAAWNEVKAKLEPFKNELKAIGATVAVVAIAVSPVGPIAAVGAAVYGAVQGLRWIAANWGKGNIVLEARVYLEKTLIPPLLGAAGKLASAVQGVADSINKGLGNLAGGLLRAAGALGTTVLRVAVSAVQWLAGQAQSLSTWAQVQLRQLAQFVTSAVGKLQAFLRKMLQVFNRVADVVLDIWQLPILLAEGLWNLIPACIRDPIVDFIGPIILKQIAIFQELARNDEAWQKTKAEVAKIIRLVFKDRDLMGAVRATFDLTLRVFNVPFELLVEIKRKAVGAWNVISKKPIEFLKNAVRSIGYGFLLLGQNFLEHLKFGIEGWLFGELAEKKIQPPKSWSDPKELFFFVLDVLGLTVDHLFELLKKRIDPGLVDGARLWINRFASAVAFVNEMLDPSKTPEDNTQGLIDKAKEFGKSILTGIAEWIMGQVAAELALMAAAAAASAGLSEVLDVLRRIYKAILTAVRWMKRILDMVSRVLDNILDIAAGAIPKVGKVFEGILHRGMPVVIGFLADQVGLGGVGQALRDVVDTLRQKVDEGLAWLIDKVVSFVEGIIRAIAAGIQAIADWWNQKEPLRSETEPHTLQFDGSGANAELAVHTTVKPVPVFVEEFRGIKGTEAQIEAAKAQEQVIYQARRELVAAEAANDKGLVQTLTLRMQGEVKTLANILQQLMDKNADIGSEGNPVQIDYPKRRASAYEPMYVGPRSEGVRITQSLLASLAKMKKDDAKQKLGVDVPALKGKPSFNQWDGTVWEFKPTGGVRMLDGKPIGLASQYEKLAEGTRLEYKEKGGTGGGSKINNCFKPYGFVPKADGGEGKDGDHVMERQLGGPDDYANLWPLDYSENRSSGATINTLKVQFGTEEMTVHDAKQKRASKSLFLLIRTVRDE